ncbi:hypothetical protein HN873_008866 [Arachis hypogaea]
MGMAHLFWHGHRRGGIQTLTEAIELGDVEACYLSGMLLLLLNDKDEDEIHCGFEFFGVARVSDAVERCREVFTQVFAGPWSESNLADLVDVVACRSGSFSTCRTMGIASKLSGESCVQCLAKYEVQNFLASVNV